MFRQCPLVLLVKMGWRESIALRSELCHEYRTNVYFSRSEFFTLALGGSHVKHLGTDSAFDRLNNFSPYLIGNTLRVRYKDEPVNAVYCENHTEHINTLWAECIVP
jgi:hypothetical protein